MIRTYFKIAYRNLLRQKAYTFINTFGLSIGLACTILIGLYVKNEFSYDTFHKNYQNIYRVKLDFKLGTNLMEGPISPAPLAENILKEFPEVETAVRLHQSGNKSIQIEEKSFYEDAFFYADSGIFDLFTLKMVAGDASKALTRPYTVVITKELGEKYFGNQNPLGKTIRLLNADTTLFEITGVVKEFPENSHWHFNILASMSSYSDSKSAFWLANNYYTYLQLKKGVDIKNFNTKLTKLFQEKAGPQMKQFFNINGEDFIKAGNRSNYMLQPISDIHLKSNLNYEIEANGNIAYVSIFLLVALFVLLNACINFTNLATARSANRAKEVGLRKVLGSNRPNLIFQFLIESVIITYIAVILAILLVELFLPYFNIVLNTHIHLGISEYTHYLPVIFGLATIVGIISGSYPALYLSSFSPAEVLKNKFQGGAPLNWLRNSLVVFQFVISIAILLGTLLVNSQLSFIQKKNLGFDKNRLLVIERTDPLKKNIKVFMDEVQKCANIEAVSLSNGVPGRETGNRGFMVEGKTTSDTYVINSYAVNYNYIKTMGMELTEGRFFSKEFATDTVAVVINESAARYLGLEKPLSQRLLIPIDDKGNKRHLTIIGVMKDFHYESLRKPINPMLFFLADDYFDGYVNIRIAPGKEKDALEFITLTWNNLAPAAPLQYFYYADQFNKMYSKEIETRHLMSILAIIAIIIASLGLLGLVAYMAERRTKEIGIRKVMGASIFSIIKMMTSEITILVVVAYIIAAPLAYWWMKVWLQQFTFKTSISLWIFCLAGVISIIIAWTTVGFLTIKASAQNPVNALKYE